MGSHDTSCQFWVKLCAGLVATVVLSSCSVLSIVGLGGSDAEEASGEHPAIAMTKELDKGINSFSTESMEKILHPDVVRYGNGVMLKGKSTIIRADSSELSNLKSTGFKPKCCNYLEEPKVRANENLAIVNYVLKLDWPDAEGNDVAYLGYITRVFEKDKEDEEKWKLMHYHLSWRPDSATQ